eukprot:GHVP01009736.1.p1 GENE.GHVP01009736.1~~GHVP01009736.1.p1  ORF type:complete len:392 (-),score=80.10 GHVP01009736.1:1794-2969(-)
MVWIAEQYNQLWKSIIRPPRQKYEIEDLGPKLFRLGSDIFEREDFFVSSRDNRVYCSHFQPPMKFRTRKLPCVVYLHGNSSCRLEAFVGIEHLLPRGITLVALDFSGSGLSDGKYVSLGHFEKEDLDQVVKYLYATGTVSSVSLWGRSMGAVTACLYAGSNSEKIAAFVADSPFTNLRKLAQEIAKTHFSIPEVVTSFGLKLVKSSVKKEAGFSIDEVSPIDVLSKCKVAALFLAAENDEMISPEHAKALFQVHGGEIKEFKLFAGDHNSQRDQGLLGDVSDFLEESIVLFESKENICLSLPEPREPTEEEESHSTIPMEPPFPDDPQESMFRDILSFQAPVPANMAFQEMCVEGEDEDFAAIIDLHLQRILEEQYTERKMTDEGVENTEN